MGIKYSREYNDIINELTNAIQGIDDFYKFLDMESSEWKELGDSGQAECARTMADDIFYALGVDHTLDVGCGKVKYDGANHIIKVLNMDNCVYIINLV